MSNAPWTSRSSSHGQISADELAKAHPGNQACGGVYHNIEHTLRVERFAYKYARRRGKSESDARFLATVAVLHDWDPTRKPGTPARVSATIAALEADINGSRPLFGGVSVLKKHLRWSDDECAMAIAIIVRTDFPFVDATRDLYISRVEKISSREGQRFVIEEAPLMSEYADKSSYYAAAPFRSAFGAVKGLVNELSFAQMTMSKLNTPAFLAAIGIPRGFDYDLQVAARFMFTDLTLPLRDTALTRSQNARMNAGSAGFAHFNAAIGGGANEKDAYKGARAAVLQALRQHRRYLKAS